MSSVTGVRLSPCEHLCLASWSGRRCLVLAPRRTAVDRRRPHRDRRRPPRREPHRGAARVRGVRHRRRGRQRARHARRAVDGRVHRARLLRAAAGRAPGAAQRHDPAAGRDARPVVVQHGLARDRRRPRHAVPARRPAGGGGRGRRAPAPGGRHRVRPAVRVHPLARRADHGARRPRGPLLPVRVPGARRPRAPGPRRRGGPRRAPRRAQPAGRRRRGGRRQKPREGHRPPHADGDQVRPPVEACRQRRTVRT